MSSTQTDTLGANIHATTFNQKLVKTISNLYDNRYQDISAIKQIRDLAKTIFDSTGTTSVKQAVNVSPSPTNIKESYQLTSPNVEIRLTTSAHTVMSNELPTIRDTSSIIDYNKFINKIKSSVNPQDKETNDAYVKFFTDIFTITSKDYRYRVDEQDGAFTFTAVRPKLRHVVELELIPL